MDNAADALIMAGAVFVLIIILSVTAFAFSNARLSLDNVFALSDKETRTIKGNEDYYYLSTSGQNANLTRTVGAETIIPAMYRAFSENYKIEFKFLVEDYYLFEDTKHKDEYGNNKKVKAIDLEEIALANESQKMDFLKAILFHRYKEESGDSQEVQIINFNNDFQGNRNKDN